MYILYACTWSGASQEFFDADQPAAITRVFRNAGLPPEEVAIMSFAQKVTLQSHQVGEQDIDELRGYGLAEEEILDVVLASAARSFFSKTLNAIDAIPDEVYLELEPELLQVLTVGHPFSSNS
jgi:alkylhydroperoxidase family enzyme